MIDYVSKCDHCNTKNCIIRAMEKDCDKMTKCEQFTEDVDANEMR